MTLAQKIVHLRENAGLSQKELAQKLGVSTGTVAEWESSDSVPTIIDIANLSTLFAVSTDSLIKGSIIATSHQQKNATSARKKKTLFKRTWFWLTVSVMVLAVTASILLINRETVPKTDENGNPMFVELTDEVYTNADNYLGYYVSVKGKVFQNLGDTGEVKSLQAWIDLDNYEQNIMIHHTSTESFKDGDYLICTGYIKEVASYTNAYGTELTVPLIYSTDLRKSSYIEVMAPTLSTIIPENLTYEKHGYSLTVNKIEFAKTETRLYLTATNQGNSTMYVDADASVIVQNGKQYNSAFNHEAEYAALPYSLRKGTTASGVVTFLAFDNTEFEYVIEIHSDNDDERFDNMSFIIDSDISSVHIPVVLPIDTWEFSELKYEHLDYIVSIDKVEFYQDETRVYISATNDGASTIHIDTDDSIVVQNKVQHSTDATRDADYNELPYSIVRGATASGVTIFPALDATEFEYIIELYSDKYDEDFEPVIFTISATNPYCQNIINQEQELPSEEKPEEEPTPYVPNAVGVYALDGERIYLNADGSYCYYNPENGGNWIGTWWQTGSTVISTYTWEGNTDPMYNRYESTDTLVDGGLLTSNGRFFVKIG